MTIFIKRSLTTLGVSGLFATAAFAQQGATITYGPSALGGATAVPTIGGLGLLLLAVLMAFVAVRLLKERRGGGSAWLIAAALTSALAAGGGGIKLVSDAQAVADCCSATVDEGGTVQIPSSGRWTVTNSSNVTQFILDMEAAPGCVFAALDGNGGVGTCNDDPSTTLGVNQYCTVDVSCVN